ncbi:MAG TPA: SRPBCC domain-containing protein [Candidatus Dormibacteraeota bacterium]|nr:SRPBCC domain-containing protein [Candidatus Dormibacteraeota bacterium]
MAATRPRLTLERTFRAPIHEVWELWTTREGIEAWWGPEGFSVDVRSLELRAGGDLVYVMSAVGQEQVDYMKKAGMPASTRHTLNFTEVSAPHRLAYTSMVDFVPGVEAYSVDTLLELHEVEGGGTRLVLTFDAMHDDRWTQLAKMGHESELDRLEKAIAGRS